MAGSPSRAAPSPPWSGRRAPGRSWPGGKGRWRSASIPPARPRPPGWCWCATANACASRSTAAAWCRSMAGIADAGAGPGRPRRPGRSAGFSLVEMLVALVVFALAVLGLLNLAGESTRTAVAIEERVLAAIVADGVAVEAAVVDVRALATEASGSEDAGGIAWRWTRRSAPTADPALPRVDTSVSPP